MAVRFERVVERAKRIAIVGTGQSAKDFDLVFDNRVLVIAVNGAINHLPRTDVWFTLDPSSENRAIMARPRHGVVYYAAVPNDYGTETAESEPMRQSADWHIRYLRRNTGGGDGRYRTQPGLARRRDTINTGNSAWGALQLAVHMEPAKIGLFAIDGYGGYLGGSGQPKNLTMMPALFASAVASLARRRIEVVNGSPRSTVNCFRRCSPEEARLWLQN